MGRYTVAVTGASGSVYGMRLIEQLLLGGHGVVAVVTDAGRGMVAHELGFELPLGETDAAAVALATFLELESATNLRVAYAADMLSLVGNDPGHLDAMFVAPASMGFCGALASGIASDLAELAADVCLRERRPLILVPRETPLSLLHLRNLAACAEAGAMIVPAMPAFTAAPASIDDLVSYVVAKALDVAGIEHGLLK